MRLFVVVVLSAFLFPGCFIGKPAFDADKKYAPDVLLKDYKVFQSVLEESHPGLYWYTSKDSMDYYFNWGRQQLADSLSGHDFKRILTYVAARINCGHTSILSEASVRRSADSSYARIFPLSLKFWPDTMVVIDNLNRKDSILKRGTVITTVFGKDYTALTDTLNRYISSDGYNLTHKLQTLSSRSGFGSLYRSVFGMDKSIPLSFINEDGVQKDTVIHAFIPVKDTTRKMPDREIPNKIRSKKETRERIRNLEMLHEDRTAIMELHSFGRKYGIQRFINKSFRKIRKNQVEHLIIDLRSNGGGSVSNSTLLSKYLRNKPFKLADSLYAVSRSSRYGAYIENYFFNKLFMVFMTRKREDNRFHFGYFERHYFKPKNKNHYNGNVYILTGGNSFSASTLFAQVINDQENVYLVGEETGGSAYGNNAWLIPEVKLPATHIRFRLPLFRLVMDETVMKDGRGIQPDVPGLPTVQAIKEGRDYKMEKALELIRSKNYLKTP